MNEIEVVQLTHSATGLIGDSPLREGIVSGFLLILFSELGDKTFFLALLLALKENKALIFAGTFGALAVMSVISVSAQHTSCCIMSSEDNSTRSYLLSCISDTQEMCMDNSA